MRGHTDNVGNEADNRKLSLERAQALKNKLVEKGILADQGKQKVFTESYAFSSTSAAGAVCNGRSTAGPVTWKVKDTGQTYKDWEAEKLAQD